MKPSEQLKAEHEAILVMLAVLEKICSRLERRETIPESHLAGILEFFQVFADKCHHAKEEEFLFPAYQSVGIPREGGPIGCMLAEHQEGRQAIAGMKAGLEVLTREGPGTFIAHARAYASLLSEHIQKENNVLFRWVIPFCPLQNRPRF
ncbi:MAG TPA: hemerythrin domain-containing protein [Candidatus Ozemobacteraceae bacterium]|nr:hemerythrin domain-containing protein [Candidatus Ozemobacteraceae bacterium]